MMIVMMIAMMMAYSHDNGHDGGNPDQDEEWPQNRSEMIVIEVISWYK